MTLGLARDFLQLRHAIGYWALRIFMEILRAVLGSFW